MKSKYSRKNNPTKISNEKMVRFFVCNSLNLKLNGIARHESFSNTGRSFHLAQLFLPIFFILVSKCLVKLHCYGSLNLIVRKVYKYDIFAYFRMYSKKHAHIKIPYGSASKCAGYLCNKKEDEKYKHAHKIISIPKQIGCYIIQCTTGA